MLCAPLKHKACLDDAGDQPLGPRRYQGAICQGPPYVRGFPRTLTARNAFWLQQALISSHIGAVCTANILCPFAELV